MKERLAVWSWVLPIIGGLLGMISTALTGERIILAIIGATVFFLGSSVLGLIFGIIALKKISRNRKLTGKGHAIVGIVLNGIVLLLAIKLLLDF
jgi:hypothetical protein